MTYDEVLDRVRDLLREKQRVTYRSLQRRFEVDADYLADIAAELIKAERVAADEDGEVLVWVGNGEVALQPVSSQPTSQSLAPATYKPNPGNSARPRAWPGCGRGRGSRQKPGSCWLRSTTGSRRGLRRLTSRTRKRCSKNYANE